MIQGEKFLSVLLASAVAISSVTAVTAEEILHAPEDANAIFTVEDPIKTRAWVDVYLFSMTVSALSAGNILSTKNSGKTFSSSDIEIGLIITGSAMTADIGSAYIDKDTGDYVSTGKAAVTSTGSASFERTHKRGYKNYAYVKSTSSRDKIEAAGSTKIEFSNLRLVN